MKSQPQPQVGIFWVFRGRVLAAPCPVAEGVEACDMVNGPHDHVDYWPVLQRQHPELADLEYEEVPRGRVVFSRADRRFCVYLDKKLHRPAVESRLVRVFGLPRSRTSFSTDPHYVTDPGELDRLFGGGS